MGWEVMGCRCIPEVTTGVTSRETQCFGDYLIAFALFM